jgi:hypothetical protein
MVAIGTDCTVITCDSMDVTYLSANIISEHFFNSRLGSAHMEINHLKILWQASI